MRVAITLAYDGTSYLGSQIQKETHNTIFGQFQKVLSSLGIEGKAVASGRTDKGVHASGQVCHIDLPPFWSDTFKLKRVLNEMLPPSIKVLSIQEVESDFHARYSAKKRIYRYIIKESKSNPFESNFISFIESVDFEAIEKNIKLFIGEHDFVNFMKTGSDVKGTKRVIYNAYAYRYKGAIILHFEGNGYLRSQIRMMVAALLALDKTQIIEKLECTFNHKVKPAPSNGLYLAKIKY